MKTLLIPRCHLVKNEKGSHIAKCHLVAVGKVQEEGEASTGSRIPEVVETGRKLKKKLDSIAKYSAIEIDQGARQDFLRKRQKPENMRAIQEILYQVHMYCY